MNSPKPTATKPNSITSKPSRITTMSAAPKRPAAKPKPQAVKFTRDERATRILAAAGVDDYGSGEYGVRDWSGSGLRHLVTGDGASCDCGDAQWRGEVCAHMLAVRRFVSQAPQRAEVELRRADPNYKKLPGYNCTRLVWKRCRCCKESFGILNPIAVCVPCRKQAEQHPIEDDE
jgi:SWIM zinc finger